MHSTLKISDIIFSLMNKLDKELTEVNHYPIKLPKENKAPYLHYEVIFHKDAAFNNFTKESVIDIQINYLDTKDVNSDDYMKILSVIDSIRSSLGSFKLKVGDRSLTYKFNIKESDGVIMTNIDFKFYDSLVDDREEINYELMKEFKIKF